MLRGGVCLTYKVYTTFFLTVASVFSPVYGEGAVAQPAFSRGDSSFSLELQAYWTGVIAGVTFERFISNKDAWHVRVAGQRIRHEDYGEHDDERGDGFGGAFGYRRYWPNGFSLGARVDLWQNSLDWTDFPGLANERRGQTDVTVLQPVLEGTWRKPLSSNWYIQPSFALGAEINVQTSGEDTGEGFIWLAGISFGRYVQ